MIIDLASACEADFLVTWDHDLLDLMDGFDSASKEFRQRFRGIRIVDPARFLKMISELDLTLQP